MGCRTAHPSVCCNDVGEQQIKLPYREAVKREPEHEATGFDIPPAHRDASGHFGLVVLVHEDYCSWGWLFVFSQLVACRREGRTQTAPYLGPLRQGRVRATRLICCCLGEKGWCSSSVLWRFFVLTKRLFYKGGFVEMLEAIGSFKVRKMEIL